MASSLKVSELNSLNQLTDNDLFLVSDIDTSTSRKVKFSTLKNNVTSQLAGTVAQNRQDAEALVETVRAALQLAIDDNTSYSTETRSSLTTAQANIDALQATVDNLDINIAPETLNSIDELAAALGDDPQVITSLQSKLDDYIAHIEARNLEAALSFGELYVDTLYGG